MVGQKARLNKLMAGTIQPHMCIIDLKQMQQYYWARVTLRGERAWKG
jgi:hypothetical protein